MPEQIKKHLDLNSGNDRGRIYRILPETFAQPKSPHLANASTEQLVATLENSNGWHRDTAARLLFQHQDRKAIGPLKQLVTHSKSSLGRMHALHSLEGLAALGEDELLSAMKDMDGDVRTHAIKLSESFLRQPVASEKLWGQYDALTQDPSINVRFQLAFTVGESKQENKIGVLRRIIERDMDDYWMRAAVLSSLANGAGPMLALLTGSDHSQPRAGQVEFLRQLVILIGAKNDPKEVAQVMLLLGSSQNRTLSLALVRALGDGLQRAGSSLTKAGDMKPFFTQALQTAADDHLEETARLQAIPLLAMTSYAESGTTLQKLLNPGQSPAIQLAAIAAVGRFNNPEVGPILIQNWSTQTPQVRSETLAALLARPERATVLLQAIEQGELRTSDLTTAQISLLKKNGSEAVRTRAAELFPTASASKRQDVIKSYQPALTLAGNLEHGKKLYLDRCSSCHRLDKDGYAVGPDLVTVKNAGKEKMLINILDPNAEVAPNFRAFEIETTSGDSSLGLVSNETSTSVTLRQPFGKETVILRPQIKRIQSQGLSLMPEGIETGLTPQDMADLLEYLAH